MIYEFILIKLIYILFEYYIFCLNLYYILSSLKIWKQSMFKTVMSIVLQDFLQFLGYFELRLTKLMWKSKNVSNKVATTYNFLLERNQIFSTQNSVHVERNSMRSYTNNHGLNYVSNILQQICMFVLLILYYINKLRAFVLIKSFIHNYYSFLKFILRIIYSHTLTSVVFYLNIFFIYRQNNLN